MSLSTYYLNQRITNLQAELNALSGGGGPTTSDLAVVLANGNSAGTDDIDMNLQDILQVDNIDLVTINGASYPPSSGTATNIAGGVASQIPFQSAPSVTAFIANGTSGQYLKSNGTATPSWDTIPVIPATPTLSQVLTAGSTAQDPLTITLNDTPNNVFTILSSSQLEVDFDDGITPNNATYQSDGVYHSGDSLSLNTNGVIGFSSDNLFANSATLGLTAPNDGYTTNPNLTITATSATAGTTSGVPSVQYYKSGRNGANNDIIGSQQFFAKNSTGVKTEFAKIETLIRNVGVGNDDGSIGIFATLNGVSTEFLRINGADGDNNFLRPLDMNGSAINSSSGNMSISASSSSGTGDITITPKRTIALTAGTTGDVTGLTTDGNITFTANTSSGGTNGFCILNADRGVSLTSAIGGSDGNIILDVNNIGDLQLEGTTLISPSASGNSGQHLRIKLNGTYYKIKLEND